MRMLESHSSVSGLTTPLPLPLSPFETMEMNGIEDQVQKPIFSFPLPLGLLKSPGSQTHSDSRGRRQGVGQDEEEMEPHEKHL